MPALDSIAVAGDGRHFAVGCSQRPGAWLYSIAPPEGADHVRQALMRVRAGSFRLHAVPVEQTVREAQWYLGEDGDGYPDDRAHVQRYMRRMAHSIAEAAIAVATGR